ncbi:hypothetical protein CYLTODRAFT_165938 [Cylindrobasidium torrendii FP15055 ss-10]|uniref:Uncharacterized protein n=1 Tax=Cylindrobasidium torrendii FP15055 ss-10 TaxID=1314674 RepID=A0A0D7BK81_9AGAR|nr:hypothetical protein CYLTODRAFT_165938 [Cylindrobasidium torrendii FP15055 ss-10]
MEYTPTGSAKAQRRSLQLQPLRLLSTSPPPSPGPNSARTPRRQASVSIPFRTPTTPREPVTLVDKHADLLHFIAQKESKCLELRSQLAVHERELLELKRKWERIVQRGFDRQQQEVRTSHTASSSTSSSMTHSSMSSVSTTATSVDGSPPPSARKTIQAEPSPSPATASPTAPSASPTSALPSPMLSTEISSWISTNIPSNLTNIKKWEKRASLFGQSIAQALDYSILEPEKKEKEVESKPKRVGSLRASTRLSSPLAAPLVDQPPSPTPTMARVPLVPRPTMAVLTPDNSPTPPPAAAPLSKTPEEEEPEDETWNW